MWQRGILEDEYGLKYDAPHYFTGNVEPSDEERKEKVPLNLRETVKIQAIPKGKCLAQMLADGEIDALESALVTSLLLPYETNLSFSDLQHGPLHLRKAPRCWASFPQCDGSRAR